MNRKATIKRKTKETNISLSLNIDGTGDSKINTGIPFFDHMLTLFSKHGLFDLQLSVKGDIEVDFHHTVEDVGICLGQAFKKAIGDAKGITRFSCSIVPMDEALCHIAVDISGRPYFNFENKLVETPQGGDFNLELVEEFFRAFVFNTQINCHIWLLDGRNFHHISESFFKALGLSLDKATIVDKRKKGVPSTKGVI